MSESRLSLIIFDELSDIYKQGLDYKDKFFKLFDTLTNFYHEMLLLEDRQFSSFFTAKVFINDKFNLDKNLENKFYQINSLHRSLIQNPERTIYKNDVNFAFKNISLIIKNIIDFSGSHPIFEIIEKLPDVQNIFNLDLNEEKYNLFNAVIVKNNIKNIKQSEFSEEIECFHEIYGEFILQLGEAYLEYAFLLMPDMSFNILNASLINLNPLTFSIVKKGYFILEPSYTVDATSLAEVYEYNFGFMIYFIKKYLPRPSKIEIIKGSIINSFFDELILNPDADFDEVYNSAIKYKPLSVFKINKNELDYIKNYELKLEFENIKNIIEKVIKPNFEKAEFSVEASFISPVYGINGRLDLLAEYPDDNNRKDIIELKMGSAPSRPYKLLPNESKSPFINLWVNHFAQILVYDLLLDSSFKNRKGSSSILYISAIESPLRNVAHFPIVINKLLNLRNNIILLENAVQNRSFKFFDKLSINRFTNIKSFLTKELNQFIDAINNLSELEKNYFYEFSSFILRENYSTKTGLTFNGSKSSFSALWNLSRLEKIKNKSILFDLTLSPENSDFNQMYLVFDFNSEYTPTSMRNGDIILLFPDNDIDFFNFESDQLLRGTIRNLEKNTVSISLRNKHIAKKKFFEHEFWRIEPDYLELSEKAAFVSLYNFINADNRKKELIFGIAEPEFDSEITFYDPTLKENQNEIINQAVNSKDYYLIQGPPGTGKTNYILNNIVKAILENTNENILVAAYTNRAVDEIAESLYKTKIEFIRIGSKEASQDFSRHLPHIIDKEELWYGYEKFMEARVIISTTSSFQANMELFDIKKFQTVIVDEASQILEYNLLNIITECRRFILIGDEKQLPPVVVQDSTKAVCDNPILNEIGMNCFSNSLFERLIKNAVKNNWKAAFGFLYFQGRMHEDIQEFSNIYYYNNALKILAEKQRQPIELFNMFSENPIEKILSQGRLIFINCPLEYGKTNDLQAEIILKIIEFISTKIEMTKESIGVISTFRAQCFNISKRLVEFQNELITVDTVERFQGSQRDYIIFSASAGNRQLLEKAQSLTHDRNIDRKLNVALTRAKSHFILIGDLNVLVHSPHYKNLISFINSKTGIYSYKEFFPIYQSDLI